MRPFRMTLSYRLLAFFTEITHLLGKYEGLDGAKPQSGLRFLNRIQTIQGGLAIEGNSLSINSVTAVVFPKSDLQILIKSQGKVV